jgi:hypothetical protein
VRTFWTLDFEHALQRIEPFTRFLRVGIVGQKSGAIHGLAPRIESQWAAMRRSIVVDCVAAAGAEQIRVLPAF